MFQKQEDGNWREATTDEVREMVDEVRDKLDDDDAAPLHERVFWAMIVCGMEVEPNEDGNPMVEISTVADRVGATEDEVKAVLSEHSEEREETGWESES
jgi:hypothetical protein